MATTIDRKGITRTKSMIKEMNLADRIDVRIEDVRKPTTYPDNHFDFIYARLILHYLNEDELDKTLKEFYRVLKRAGSIFIVVRSTDDWEAKLKGSTY
ncbi:MAG: class I SAM-dependent methyltransferase, partial [Candidatus Aenigmarchaeota archaeon]|nr:class I SAM-dependent methyltransferase [Candidatus Aenigmarchaeota archaeon]